MNVTIHVPGHPVAKGRPRFARHGKFIQTYTPKKTQTFEDIVRFHALEAWAPREPLGQVPITLAVRCWLQIPKSWSKRLRNLSLSGAMWPLGKPDLDNYLKLVGDALNGVVYLDDSAVVAASISKRFSDNPGLDIEVSWPSE